MTIDPTKLIDVGTTANDGTGDPLRTAFTKANTLFTELWNDDEGDVNQVTGTGGITASPTTGDVSVSITDGGVTNAKMAANSVDSDQYVDGSIDTVHLANNIVTYAKLGVEFKSTEALGSVSTTATLDFNTDQVFTATMTANTTFSFSNANIGMTKDLILTGSFDPTFPAGTKQIAGTYDGSVSNFIQIVAVANGDYWLSVSQEQV